LNEPYSLRIAGPAARAIEHELSESVAWAVIEFVSGSLLADPHRVGKPLRGDLAGKYAARRGAYRVIYEIDEGNKMVKVVLVQHRADVYRPR